MLLKDRNDLCNLRLKTKITFEQKSFSQSESLQYRKLFLVVTFQTKMKKTNLKENDQFEDQEKQLKIDNESLKNPL